MDARIGLALFTAGWLALCTVAETKHRDRLADDPVMRAGVEAELAGRYCAGIRTDAARFRTFAHEHGMSHADFFTRKRTVGLESSLADLMGTLRTAPAAACERLWADYGVEGRKVSLLRRA